MIHGTQANIPLFLGVYESTVSTHLGKCKLPVLLSPGFFSIPLLAHCSNSTNASSEGPCSCHGKKPNPRGAIELAACCSFLQLGQEGCPSDLVGAGGNPGLQVALIGRRPQVVPFCLHCYLSKLCYITSTGSEGDLFQTGLSATLKIPQETPVV